MSWKKEVGEIEARRKAAGAQGGKEAVELQHAKGRLTIRERIEARLGEEEISDSLLQIQNEFIGRIPGLFPSGG